MKMYLRRIRIALAAEDGEEMRCRALALAEKLEGQIRTEVCTGVSAAACATANAGGSDALAGEEGVLWLTDSAPFAEKLSERGQAVVAWLHEGNGQAPFLSVRYAVEDPEELDAPFFDRIYRRHAGIPWDICDTARCLVRETTEEDAEDFARIYRELAHSGYRDAWCPEPEREREYIREYIEKIYGFYGYGVWTVVWKETGEVIGRVGFEQPAASYGRRRQYPYLGYVIAEKWQRKGIATEVCRGILAYAREELRVEAVEVFIDAENLPSLRLAAKLGFVGEKIRLEDGREYFEGLLPWEAFPKS